MSNLVSFAGTKLINLNTITGIADTDYVVIQKDTNGDKTTKKILWSDVKALIVDLVEEIELTYEIQRTGSIIDEKTDLYISSSTQTLTMPATSVFPVSVKTLTGFTATLQDTNGNIFEGTGTSTQTVIGPACNKWILDGSVWRPIA